MCCANCRREFSPHDRRWERRSPSHQGRSCRKTPGPYKEDSDICYFHTTYGDKAGNAARTDRPILGLDFLSAHGLLVNPVGRQVLDSKSLKPISKAKTATGEPRSKFAAALCSIAPMVRSLPALFPAIVGDGKGKPSPKHKIRRTIEATGRPVFAKARRLDPDKLRQAEAEFRQLEAAGVIRCSDLPWYSPLHMVRKKDGSWLPCVDYRRLNLATTHDRYPLPSISLHAGPPGRRAEMGERTDKVSTFSSASKQPGHR
jgi:hypothetical protein